jgi:Caspase domain/Sel1 repeat
MRSWMYHAATVILCGTISTCGTVSTVTPRDAVGKASVADTQIEQVLEKLQEVQAADVSNDLKVMAETVVHNALRNRLELATRGRFFALVIGNSDYEELPDLETATADAEAVTEMLVAKYGFQATLLRNATRYQILDALDELREELGSTDELLIFYSGHSELDRESGHSYWLPVDSETDNLGSWIPTSAIADILNAMPARHVLIVADSAFSELLPPTALVPRGAMGAEAGPSVAARSRTALVSGGLSPVLDAGGGEHSVFTQTLLNSLRVIDGPTGGQELYREVAATSELGAATHEPGSSLQYAPIRHAQHEGGDFKLTPTAFAGRVVETAGHPGAPAEEATRRGDDLLVVDCRMPPEVRRLGRHPRLTYPGEPRPTRTTALDCQIRGGEYVAYSRADYATALQIWLPLAEQGDAKAQTYVGETYERGLGGGPDYVAAADWYRRAAEQGYAPAQINLGSLYEQGLGVPKDEATALSWYRRAVRSGAAAVDVAAAGRGDVGALPGEHALDEREIERLRREIERLEVRIAETERAGSASGEQESLGGPQVGDLRALTQAVSEERPVFAQPAFQCLADLQDCSRYQFAWFDCQLTMLVCLFDLVLP